MRNKNGDMEYNIMMYLFNWVRSSTFLSIYNNV